MTSNLYLRIFIRSYVRVRFAPSPTGQLHLGGLRTALYNYFFARAANGSFIVRIEDTDQSRLVSGAEDRLHEALEWMGIRVDEGPRVGGPYGPYIQSRRLHLYRESVEKLLENRTAYRCFCTERRLELLRKEAAKRNEIPRYDNHCRHLKDDELRVKLAEKKAHVIRFKLQDEPLTFDDLVYGRITQNIAEREGDPIIFKSDGFPTYHLANVVDDHSMKITHVLRGVEWQISTPKHISLHLALNQEPPQFAHLPLIVNKDGTKLSKRQGDIHVQHFKNSGYHARAILNFVMRVGGGCGSLGETIFDMQELIERFSLDKIKSNSSRLEMERLNILNRADIIKMINVPEETDVLIERVRNLVLNKFHDRLGISDLQAETLTNENILKILSWSVDRISVVEDLVKPNLEFVWIIPDQTAVNAISDATTHSILEKMISCLREIQFSQQNLNSMMKEFSKNERIKYNRLMKLLRAALSNLQEGPSVAEMMTILGKEATLQRLNYCQNSLNQSKLSEMK